MKDAYYFPHDCNAIQDPKMMILLAECGAAGVGLYWIVIEILHQQEWGTIGGPELTQYLAFYGRMGAYNQTMIDKCEKVLFDTKLLMMVDGMVTSRRVNRNLEKREESREIGRFGALKRWGTNRVPMAPQCPPNARKGKESKGKESRDSIAKPSAVATPPVNKSVDKSKPMTDIQKVVTAFKMLQGYPKDDKGWDKLNFSRCSRSAKSLLDFLGSWQSAVDCLQDTYERLTGKGLTVTLETICKHAADWKRDQNEQIGRNGHGILPMQGNGISTIGARPALPAPRAREVGADDGGDGPGDWSAESCPEE